MALALALVGAVTSAQAAEERTIALRFYDDNALARDASLGPAALQELQSAMGMALVPRGRDDDGAFRFAVPASLPAGVLRQALHSLRATGALVYAEVEPVAAKRATTTLEPARALLVTMKPGAKRDAKDALRAALSLRLGAEVRDVQARAGTAARVVLPRVAAPTEAAALVAQVAALPDVLHVEVERRALPQATAPADPMFASQWNLNDAAGGINAPGAWAVTTGGDEPIAVLDTGVLPHPDLAGRVVGGYDMVADAAFAGDGDGRDADPTDPGDFVSAADSSDPASRLYMCAQTPSTWHGTMVAGALAAVANNGVGLAPITWRNPILNVRVMGKCGGALSDVADGIRWAAGLPVPGVPANPRPARVVNLSLSGQGACGPILQSAITDALAAGTAVVVAAGNDNLDAGDRWPANCNGVIAVGATSRDGSRAFYSNYGERIAVSAPGGGFGGSIQILRNTGGTAADPAGYGYGQQVGTSLATPHVSGTVSLVQALSPGLSPAEIRAQIESSARPFPAAAADGCTTARCGAGIVDAARAVAGVQTGGAMPVPAPIEAPQPVAPPSPVTPPPPAPAPPPVPGADEAPPAVPMPIPGGWTAKDPGDVQRLTKAADGARSAARTTVTKAGTRD